MSRRCREQCPQPPVDHHRRGEPVKAPSSIVHPAVVGVQLASAGVC